MIFTEYLDAINVELDIKRYPNQKNRWTAQIKRCETKDGPILSSVYGDAKSPIDAIKDYVEKIKGKTIVINASSKDRKEFTVPDEFVSEELK